MPGNKDRGFRVHPKLAKSSHNRNVNVNAHLCSVGDGDRDMNILCSN